ncbi:MAG: transglutaminase-like domain-containing protein, partial [Gammaproteobacteria bacterium]|nr:transglutaminase-like domain-containing protein [Gammaproteobacteria bacterium]
PIDTQYSHVFEQNISVQGMRIRRSRLKKDGTREIVARITRKQDVAIGVDFAVHVSPSGIPHFVTKKDKLNSARRQNYIAAEEMLPANEESVLELVESLVGNTAEPEQILNILFDYSATKIKTEKQGSDDVLLGMKRKKASVLGKARLLTTLARSAKIPARLVMGVILDEEIDVEEYYWVELNTNGKWLSYDPSEGYVQEMPANYLPVRKSGESFILLPDPVKLDQVNLEVMKRDASFDFFAEAEKQFDKSFGDILNLNRLSLSTRLTLAFLLLLPLGALVTIFIRQILGPNVYGTFTPTFFALSLTQVGWVTGGIILCIVTVIGVAGRSFTSLLGLNRVSRLTVVFILVAISMIFSVSLMVHFGWVTDGNIVLLPIVILTYMIDRIYKLADSDGLKVALNRLAWTIVVSAIVASVLQLELFGLWMLSYPEIHLMTAAFVIIISLYKGQKLMRKIGLSWMLEPEKIDADDRGIPNTAVNGAASIAADDTTKTTANSESGIVSDTLTSVDPGILDTTRR